MDVLKDVALLMFLHGDVIVIDIVVLGMKPVWYSLCFLADVTFVLMGVDLRDPFLVSSFIFILPLPHGNSLSYFLTSPFYFKRFSSPFLPPPSTR